MGRQNNPQFIILHCTASPDKGTQDWDQVRKFHIMPPPHGRGWRDIGYHYGVELIGDKYEVLKGRSPHEPGAHCHQDGMNFKSLGVCMVGGDLNTGFGPHYPLPDAQRRKTIELCADLCREHNISPANIRGHKEIDSGKACPGVGVDMDEFRKDVAREMMNEKPDDEDVGEPEIKSSLQKVLLDLDKARDGIKRLIWEM